MKIEEGKFYKTADGRRVGPMYHLAGSHTGNEFSGLGATNHESVRGSLQVYNKDGSVYKATYTEYTDVLVSEWTEEVKPFVNLTDIEKGELLFKHHEGEVIEVKLFTVGLWLKTDKPVWDSRHAYRVKPTMLVTGNCEVGPDGKPDFTTWKEVDTQSN
tara:strand:+ start:609 stop:1082 length:474 start_codon:yes stop_codon:yes gene_type:complete